MNPSSIEVLATVLLVLAVLHSFAVGYFARWAHRYPSGSIPENVLHFLAETEVVRAKDLSDQWEAWATRAHVKPYPAPRPAPRPANRPGADD